MLKIKCLTPGLTFSIPFIAFVYTFTILCTILLCVYTRHTSGVDNKCVGAS